MLFLSQLYGKEVEALVRVQRIVTRILLSRGVRYRKRLHRLGLFL